MSQISIIICSRKLKFDSLIYNIENTIGTQFEINFIDNSKNQYSIAEAYNMGLRKSNGEIICFIHDDIKFLSRDWGNILRRIFVDNPSVGLIGIAGGKTKSKMPSAWWDGGPNFLKIVQHYKNHPSKVWDQGFYKNELVEVASIDGVFMAMKSHPEILFDERIKGFHNYDLFLSLKNHLLKRRVVVTNEILLEHYSSGNVDKSWCLSTSFFHRLYKNKLPILLEERNEYSNLILEFTIGRQFIEKCLEEKLKFVALYWWFKLFQLKPISKFHFRFFQKLIFD